MASEIESIIEDIEKYIDGCKPKAFSSTEIIVNRDDIESYLDELKEKTPQEIKQYQKIINNREGILADAKKKADQIIKDAEVHTTELVSEHQIMQQAYAQANEVVNLASKQAQEMVDKATAEANEIRSSAIAYTDSILKTIQKIISDSIDSTKTHTDSFLSTMQGYLDTVTSNRMELSPNPTDTVMDSSFPGESTVSSQESAVDKLSRRRADASNSESISANEDIFNKN